MPRVIQVTVPNSQTEGLVRALEKHGGYIGLQVQKQVSRHPPGDIITIQTTNRSMHHILRKLAEHEVAVSNGSSIMTTEVASIVSQPSNREIVSDSAEATWEEMELMIAREGNMTLNGMLLMAVSGVMASIGLMSSTLHLVIAAMVIAPGFEPIARVSHSLAAASGSWQRGIIDTGKGYVSLLAGALIGASVIFLFKPAEFSGSYLPANALITYWSTITVPALFVSSVAAAGGAVLIATNRSMLTGGVMIALALIPTPTLVAIGLISGDLSLAGKGLLRWAIEVALVLLFSALVFGWKRMHIQKRKALW